MLEKYTAAKKFLDCNDFKLMLPEVKSSSGIKTYAPHIRIHLYAYPSRSLNNFSEYIDLSNKFMEGLKPFINTWNYRNLHIHKYKNLKGEKKLDFYPAHATIQECLGKYTNNSIITLDKKIEFDANEAAQLLDISKDYLKTEFHEERRDNRTTDFVVATSIFLLPDSDVLTRIDNYQDGIAHSAACFPVDCLNNKPDLKAKLKLATASLSEAIY